MPELRKVVKTETTSLKPRRFVFVLLNNFSLLSFASAIESLRIANRMSGRTLYEWCLVGETADSVASSSGTTFHLDADFGELNRDDTLLICGGIDVQEATTKKLLGWVRREARKGILVGGLCTAAHTLARAGLLDNKKATIHWENADSFTEEFENVELTKSVFVIDGNRMTTAGGTSSIDLMLKIIADEHGEELANSVARPVDLFQHTDGSGHAKAFRPDPDRRAPSKAEPGHSGNGTKPRRTDQPVHSGQRRRHVYPAVGAAVPPVSEPVAQTVLYGVTPAKGAKPADANRHERDQCGIGMRVCLAQPFLQVLSGALRYNALSGARHACDPSVGLTRWCPQPMA